MNIYQRLNAVMKAVGYVQKEDKKVNNQYTFVSHDAVTAAVRPFLIEHGIVMMTDVKECRQDGNRTEAIVVLRFVNIDKPEDQVGITCFGYGIDPQDKGPGKAVSYAVKYGILKTLCLETGDDPERDMIEHKPKATHSATDGALESLSPADRKKAEKLAIHISSAFAAGEDWSGFESWEAEDDNELKIAVWSLLASGVRSKIKAMKIEADKTVTA